MTQQVVMNPWEMAMNPPEQTQAYWGQMAVSARLVCLVKGVGKIDYEEGAVMPDGSEPRPVTAVSLSLTPLQEMKLQWAVEREPIAQAWGEWGDITLPSLRECGVLELPALNGAFVKAEMAPTGRKWTNQNGETREGTAFKFLKVFASEAECRADFASQKNGGNGNGAKPAAAAPNTEQASTSGNGNGASKDQETALKFAKIYVKNACKGAGGDLEKARTALQGTLAAQPLISKFYTVDSPEIVELMAAELVA